MKMSDLTRKKARASVMSSLWGVFWDEEQENFGHTIIVGLVFLSQNPGIDTLREHMYHKIVEANLPRYRSIVQIENNDAVFYEIEKEKLDMNYHVAHMFDKGMNENIDVQDVYDWIGKQYDYENRLDASKPLWRVLLVPKLVDGRASVLIVVNHMLGDGMSQLAIFLSLTDYSEKSKTLQMKRKKRDPPEVPLLSRMRILARGVYRGLGFGKNPPDDANPLTTVSRKRITGVTEKIELDRIKQISKKLGGQYTVNDILLTLMNLTIVEYFREVDAKFLAMDVAGKFKRVSASFPIDMRPKDFDFFKDGTGNVVSTGYLQLHFDYESRLGLLKDLKVIFDEYKLSPGPFVGKLMHERFWKNYLTPSQYKEAIKKLGNHRTAMLSNVMGPQMQVSMLGCNVDELQFFAFGGISLYFGILSYNGFVNATFVIDPETEPEPYRLAKYWKIEFDRLYEEVLEVEQG